MQKKIGFNSTTLINKKGLVIIGFPSNEFGQQESGTNEDIKHFVKKSGVTFLMSEKTTVNGQNPHPIYEYIHSHFPENVQGNFEKVCS